MCCASQPRAPLQVVVSASSCTSVHTRQKALKQQRSGELNCSETVYQISLDFPYMLDNDVKCPARRSRYAQLRVILDRHARARRPANARIVAHRCLSHGPRACTEPVWALSVCLGHPNRTSRLRLRAPGSVHRSSADLRARPTLPRRARSRPKMHQFIVRN